jgi:hypothetical protein
MVHGNERRESGELNGEEDWNPEGRYCGIVYTYLRSGVWRSAPIYRRNLALRDWFLYPWVSTVMLLDNSFVMVLVLLLAICKLH